MNARPLDMVRLAGGGAVAIMAIGCILLGLADDQSLPVGAVFLLLIIAAGLSGVYPHADLAAALAGSVAYVDLEYKQGHQGTLAWFAATICFALAVVAVRVFERYLQDAEGRILQTRTLVDELTTHDDASGLLKRRYGELALEEEVMRARRTGEPLTVVLCAPDPVQEHPVELPPDEDAEAALMGAALRDALRTTDRFSRLASSTFAAILPYTDAAGGAVVAEKVRRMCLERGGRPVRCGVASFPANAVSAAELIEEAMAALQLARAGDLELASPGMLG